MAGTAVRGRLTWQTATVAAVTRETASAVTLSLSVPDWPGHRAGQHVDVRLTADDGYQAERAYSIASAPGEPLTITVERLDDGEVSPYLTEEARPGDQLEVRGLELRHDDEPGFWETYGYHNHGDPWREQRYAGD